MRTVLKLSLDGFARDAPKKALFAVRERLDAIVQLLVEDVQSLWGKVRKPPELAAAALKQLLEVEVVLLAHLKFNPDGFERHVATVRG